MTQHLCPYCRESYSDEVAACPSCHTEFPWSSGFQLLRDELKEREVNRGRATFTLIDELFNASKGGKPVSVSALKGFAFAWLFPRTLIVVGSLLTGALLVAQTVILYKQTQLLQGQTAAAQVEQTEKLRLRIPETIGLNKSFNASLDSLRYFSASQPPCTSSCGIPLKDLLTELTNSSATGGFTPTGLSQPAQMVLRTVEALVQAREDRRPNEAQSKRSLDDALNAAGPRCFAPIDAVSQVSKAVRVLDGWTQAGPIWNDLASRRPLEELRNFRHETASLQDFLHAVWEVAGEARDGLSVITAMCDLQLRRDIASLTALEGPETEK